MRAIPKDVPSPVWLALVLHFWDKARWCAGLALALAGLGVAFAQPIGRTVAAEKAAARASTFEAALAAFRTRNTVSAENLLFRDNLRRPGSIDWSIECADRLIHAALALRERADFLTANIVSARALDYASDAKANQFARATAQRRARIHEITGFVYENLLPDPASAQAAFTAAQRELPNSKSAQAGLNRLKNQSDALARLPGGRG